MCSLVVISSDDLMIKNIMLTMSVPFNYQYFQHNNKLMVPESQDLINFVPLYLLHLISFRRGDGLHLLNVMKLRLVKLNFKSIEISSRTI